MRFQSKYLIPIGSILFGGIFAVLSLLNYEIYSPTKGPMAGFMPVLVGGFLVFVGILDLIQAKKYEEPTFDRQNWLLVICVLLVIAGHYIIGVLPGGFILAFCWLKFKERYSWKTTLITMIFLMVLVIGVFAIWLDIPFEYGIVGELLIK